MTALRVFKASASSATFVVLGALGVLLYAVTFAALFIVACVLGVRRLLAGPPKQTAGPWRLQ